MFTITVQEFQVTSENVGPPVERFRQTVDALDLPKLIQAINHKPRVRKPRAKDAQK